MRDKPFRKSVSLENASFEAVARWEQTQYMFQVYQYENKHLLSDHNGKVRVLSERSVWIHGPNSTDTVPWALRLGQFCGSSCFGT